MVLDNGVYISNTDTGFLPDFCYSEAVNFFVRSARLFGVILVRFL